MKYDLKQMFATPVWTFDLSEDDKYLVKSIEMDGSNFSRFIDKQKQIDGDKFDIYQHDFLDFNGYGISKLKEKILEAVEVVKKDSGWPEFTPTIKTKQSVLYPNEWDTPHTHFGAELVGVFYVTIPENSGSIMLCDPRGHVDIPWHDKHLAVDKWGRPGRTFYEIKPKPGMLILFPNYVIHSTEPNLSDENRICIVMNIRVRNDTGSV